VKIRITVRRQFKVEAERLLSKLLSQRKRERRLAHLPWAKQGHSGKLLEQLSQFRLGEPGIMPWN